MSAEEGRGVGTKFEQYPANVTAKRVGWWKETRKKQSFTSINMNMNAKKLDCSVIADFLMFSVGLFIFVLVWVFCSKEVCFCSKRMVEIT